MTNTRSAAAPGLPATTTRRAALASLAGVGAALGFPRVAKAAAALEAPDAVLIAHAAMVEDMCARYHTALTRWGDLTTEAEAAMPSRPDKPTFETGVESHFRADGVLVNVTLKPQTASDIAARAHYKAVYDAWEQACADQAERMGVNAAEGLVDDLQSALADVVDDLTAMAATTPAGLAAKARAALALDPHQDCSMDEREQALFVSLARDALAIGGAA